MSNVTDTASSSGDATGFDDEFGIMEMASPYIYLGVRLALAGSAVWYSGDLSS